LLCALVGKKIKKNDFFFLQNGAMIRQNGLSGCIKVYMKMYPWKKVTPDFNRLWPFRDFLDLPKSKRK
jgi:hypothetical protein